LAEIGNGEAVGGYLLYVFGRKMFRPYGVDGDDEVLQVYVSFGIATDYAADGDVHVFQ